MKRIVAAILLLFSLNVSAQILLISDIDDTLKVSNILDKDEALENAFKTKNVFYGMSEIYQELQRQNDVKFVYLSNAPGLLMKKKHQEFLQRHLFPEGELLMPEKISDFSSFKQTQLQRLLRTQNYQKIILVGDNGEEDTEVYRQVVSELKLDHVLTFIHMTYSPVAKDSDRRGKIPLLGQVPYLTPVEVAIELYRWDLLQGDLINELVDKVLLYGKRKNKDQVVFPKWLNCRGYQWSTEVFELVLPIKNLVEMQCRQ